MTETTTVKAPIYTHSAEPEVGFSAQVRAEVDANVRSVVLWLFTSGLFWLLASTVFGWISSIQLHSPSFLNFSFSHYGVLSPVASLAFSRGWCACAALGVSVWLVTRLSGRAAPGKFLAAVGVALWNAGLLFGLASVLLGKMLPFNGFELPFGSQLTMALGFGAISLWLLLSFRETSAGIPLAAMFVVCGLLWSVWSQFVGVALLTKGGLSGVVNNLAASWASKSCIWLWLVPTAIGAAYYVIPKVTGKPVYSGVIGRYSFWLYFLAAGLSFPNWLVGGPVPVWLASLSAAASVLMLVPLIGTVYNLQVTASNSDVASASPSVRFVSFSLWLLLGAGFLTSFSALRFVGHSVQFTLFVPGVETLLVNGFVTISLFGAIYYIMPRLSGCEWLSSSLINFHFLGAVYGTCMGAMMFILSGLAAGSALKDGATSFAQVLELGSLYYFGHSLSFVLVILGYLAFGLHYLLMALRIGQPEGEPTVLHHNNSH